MHLVLQILSVARVLENKAYGIFKPHGLTPAQFNVLHLVSDKKEGIRASDLASALIVDPSNVTGLLRRMKAVGLLQELENEWDRRQHVVAITPKGRSVWKAALRDYEKSLAAIDAKLPSAGRAPAEKLLSQLREIL